MDERELEEILEDIKRRANANTQLEPPQPLSRNDSSSPSSELNLSFDSSVLSTPADGMFNITTSDENNDVTLEPQHHDDAPKRKKDKKPNKNKKGKKGIIAIVVVIIIAAICAGVYFATANKEDSNEVTTSTKAAAQEDVVADTNPLTGETGYNTSAIGKRPVAVVVENEYSSESVRPQWALADADIVLEGESEYSTRLLLFWADYTSVPSQVGPTRSARPPFIRFSQLFDSIFIHAGLSHSKDNYVGADTVFTEENVDHINGLEYESDSSDAEYFGRDYTRTSTLEHTAFLNGTNLPKLIDLKGFDTDIDSTKFTSLKFNSTAQPLSSTSATSCKFVWSSSQAGGRCPKTGTYTYDESTQKYTTTDFDSEYGTSEVSFENLIFLLDETEYIVKNNYKTSGNSETYCDYKLSGGKGTVLSQGTAVEITWGVENNKLWMKTADGEDLVLNPGKSYIGYGSSNYGGSIELNPSDDTAE